ncbi:MAG: hypothetical protein WA206_11900 [Candidatus Binatus sp.]
MTNKALQPNWSRIVGARGVKRRSGNFFRLSLFAVTCGLTALIVLPLLPPETYLRYTHFIGISQPKFEHR